MSDIELIDSHCHLIFENFESDLEDVVLRLRSKGVKKLVHACCELTEIPKLKKISHEFDEIYYSVGLHPFLTSQKGVSIKPYSLTLAWVAKEFMSPALGPSGVSIGHNLP